MNNGQWKMDNEIETSLRIIATETKKIKGHISTIIEAADLPNIDADFMLEMIALQDEMATKNDPYTRQTNKIKQIIKQYMAGLAREKAIPIKQLFYLDGEGPLFYKSRDLYWLEVGERITIKGEEHEVTKAIYNEARGTSPQEQRLYVTNISLKERITINN